jgi:hypothetical protein
VCVSRLHCHHYTRVAVCSAEKQDLELLLDQLEARMLERQRARTPDSDTASKPPAGLPSDHAARRGAPRSPVATGAAAWSPESGDGAGLGAHSSRSPENGGHWGNRTPSPRSGGGGWAGGPPVGALEQERVRRERLAMGMGSSRGGREQAAPTRPLERVRPLPPCGF